MNVGIYIRVSTREQAQEGYSVGSQTEKLTAYCKAMGWTLVKSYIDPGFSGGSLNRPAIQELIEDVKAHRIDMVLVKKLDRLSRSQKDTLYLIEDIFLKNKTDFVSMEENFDTSTAFGRAMIGILSVFAQLERDMIRERTADGRAERAKAGLFHGGPNCPVGYDYVDGKLVINDYEAMQVRKVYDLFLSGWPVSRIWDYMKNSGYKTKYASWNSSSAVYSVLQSPVYTGKIKYHDEIHEGLHEAIIDQETFDKVQVLLADPIRYISNGKDAFKITKLLGGGMIRCAQCGSTFFAKGVPSGHPPIQIYRPYYICYSRAKVTKSRVMGTCNNKMYAVAELDYLVVMEIKKLLFDDDYLNSIIGSSSSSQVPDSINLLKERAAKLEEQRKRMLDLYQTGIVDLDEIQERIVSLDKERATIASDIDRMNAELQKVSPTEVRSMLSGCNEVFETGSMDERRALVKSLIKYIEIDNDDVRIHWTFA